MKSFLCLFGCCFFVFSCSENREDERELVVAEKVSEGEFWEWFGSKEEEFIKALDHNRALESEDARVKKNLAEYEIEEKLRAVNPYFLVYFSYTAEGCEIIVSTDGEAAHFAAVDALVKAAPEYEAWKFTALMLPLERSVKANLRLGGEEVKIGHISYHASENQDERIDVTIILLEDVTIHQEQFDERFSGVVMGFLGERLAARRLGNVTVEHYDENALEELFPFAEIYQRTKEAIGEEK